MFERQHNKEENKLIINKSSKLYSTRKEEYLKREYTLEIIENIKKFFKHYEIKIWERDTDMNDIVKIIRVFIEEET